MNIWVEFLVIFILVLISAFFAASEIAIVSVRRSLIKELIEKGSPRAKIIEQLLANPNMFLATIQIGITLAGTFASAIGGTIAVEYLKVPIANLHLPVISENAEFIAVAIIVVCISYISLVAGELVPKSLALRYAEKIAISVAPVILFCSKLFSFGVKFLVGSSNILLKPFHDETSFGESKISEEEFRIMLDEGKKSGVIDKTEHELINSIFEFTETTAKEIIVPRTDITAIEISIGKDKEKLIHFVSEMQYSRLPVYENNLDNIIGIVYTKDVIPLIEHPLLLVFDDLIRPAIFVPETKKISELLREMQQKKIHMVIVNDEYGGTAGIVTMEDIIEEIVGEIQDESDEELKQIEQGSDGAFMIDGRYSVSDFNERFNSFLPTDEGYDTMSGFLQTIAGKIPDTKDEHRYNNWSFIVVKKSQRRIRQIQVKKIAA
ncbi:MAG: hemolysin family protein [Bacteroidota bacterium]